MVDNIVTAVKPEVRQTIDKIEGALARCPESTHGDSPDCPLTHSFADGCYVREIFIPAGTLLTGKIHRHSHPNFLMKGVVDVLTEGGGMERLTAPCYMISPAGTKRVVLTHTDVVWVTVHVTDMETPEDAETEIIAPNYEDEQLRINQSKEAVICLS